MDLIVTSKCHLKKISVVDLPDVDLRVHCAHLYKDSIVPGHPGCLTKVIFHHCNPEQVSMGTSSAVVNTSIRHPWAPESSQCDIYNSKNIKRQVTINRGMGEN